MIKLRKNYYLLALTPSVITFLSGLAYLWPSFKAFYFLGPVR
jgi:hypothetical protein